MSRPVSVRSSLAPATLGGFPAPGTPGSAPAAGAAAPVLTARRRRA
ncbi:hypothetical protein OG625_34860 [Streptomyces sp. NBC_01351]|nr:hypothetical protein [Streptomyces sp. NBC_01351]